MINKQLLGSPVFAVRHAMEFESDIFYLADGVQYDGKSLIDVTNCWNTHPEHLDVLIMGADEERFVPALMASV